MEKFLIILIGGIFALIPIIIFITYITHTEKIVMPLLIILLIGAFLILRVKNYKKVK